MNRIPIPAFLIAAAFLAPSLRARALPGNERPNIIVIVTDDQRWDALGYSGNPLIQTPHMDQLARDGIYFSQALVSTPICSASRASVFTGVHERTHRYTFRTGPIQERFMALSYPKLLKDAGYETAFYGKFGVTYENASELFDRYESYDRNNRFGDRRGYFYKTLEGDTVHLTRYTGQQALDYLEEAESGKPFCLSLSFSAPHAHDRAEDQYFWQDETSPLYEDLEMPGPYHAEDADFNRLPQKVREGFNRVRWHWRYDSPEKYQHSIKGYYRMIAGVDLEIDKIRQKLKERKLDKNTVIILMGDNGYFLGERQLAGKWLMYEHSIRVPMIIYDPRHKGGRTVDEMALNIDLPATIVDLAGLAPPAAYQGLSLRPFLENSAGSLERDTVLIEHLWEFEHIPPSEGLRTGDWKYLRYVNDRSAEELYHLAQDPEELQDLSGQPGHRKRLLEFREQCDRLGRRFSDPGMQLPDGLRVEYLRDPHLAPVRDSLPEFSWQVPASAKKQQAYQILVASSEDLLNMNQGDLWDSKEVRSGLSTNIEYAGTPLEEGKSYFWKLRIWDADNRLTDYSEAQQFTTGSFGTGISTPNRFISERIQPVSIQRIGAGVFLADFGKDAFGKLELNFQGRVKGTLTIRLGEKLENGRIDRKPGGTIRYQEVQVQADPEPGSQVIELPPDRRNTGPRAIALPDSFGVIMPFRYVEIEGVDKLGAGDLCQIAYFQFFDGQSSHFTSSDTLLNQIWELCKYSMKATSFAGLYVDGDRERIPYEADAYINQLSHYAVDAEYAMARQTIEYFMDHPTWPTEWLLHTVMMVYQDYYYTGDTELLRHYYEPLKVKTLLALARADGLISVNSPAMTGEYMLELGFADSTQRLRDIVDWPSASFQSGGKKNRQQGERDGYEMVPVNTVVNAFFYHNMVLMAELAAVAGTPADEDFFHMMAARVKHTVNTLLFDPENRAYLDGEGSEHQALHASMMPLAFGMVNPQHVPAVADHIKSRGMACSVYGAQYLLEALYLAGEAPYALQLMTATHDRSWWNMIRTGSTITTEAWDLKYKPNQDWNHAWGAAPGNIIPRYMWGIRPGAPGFAAVMIDPQLNGLESSEIVHPTLRGSIACSYEKVHDRLSRYRIELPGNMVSRSPTSKYRKVFSTRTGRRDLKSSVKIPRW